MDRTRLVTSSKNLAFKTSRRSFSHLARKLGPDRVSRWTLESAEDLDDAIHHIEAEISAVRRPSGADVIGNYIRGYQLLGRTHGDSTSAVYQFQRKRAIIDRDTARVPSRVVSYLRREEFIVRDDAPMSDVVAACTEGRPQTWITPAVVEAYLDVERAGAGFTLTAWRDSAMVGGFFGVKVGHTIGILSMFHRENRAGSIVLAALVQDIGRKWELVDCGLINENFRRYGAHEVSAEEFSDRVVAGLAPETYNSE